MLRRTIAILTAIIAIAAGTLTATAPAQAADGVYCNDLGKCYLTISRPSDPPPNPDSNGWTAGAPTCYYENSESGLIQLGWTEDQIRVFDGGANYTRFYGIVDCGGSASYWSNVRQCYVYMKEGQWPARPAGVSQEAGYYGCIMFAPGTGGDPTLPGETNFWSETVPPGLQVLTPGRAAAMLIETFQLRGVDIGMAPQLNPVWGHRRSYVGIPVWLWVDNPQPLTWGPYTETATLGGQTITATAQVTGIRWNMGDGSEVVCGNTGTAYSTGYGLTDSPTCSHRYDRISQNQPGDRYTVTATSQWVVTWTSVAGANGTVNLTTANATQLEINEIQSVNVTPTTPNG